MHRVFRTTAVAVLGAFVLTGCATRGQLRTAIDEQRTEIDAALAAERADRIAGDERLAADLATLRNDLQALRTEFNAQIEAVAAGLRFALPVHFAFDDATVRTEDMDALERFAEVISRHYMGSVVTIEGFADPAGPAAYNVALSQRRADAVRDYLIQAGISAQLRTVGYGQERLVVPGAQRDDPGAELNRRVVFVVESPGGASPAVTALDLRDL
jgi:outer membrane protein OmpA-like peptidoglycan-associated protein